jgi:hypothetical protein
MIKSHLAILVWLVNAIHDKKNLYYESPLMILILPPCGKFDGLSVSTPCLKSILKSRTLYSLTVYMQFG